MTAKWRSEDYPSLRDYTFEILVSGLPTMPELGVVAIASKTHFTNGSLGVSQGNHWVHFRRAPGRNVAG